MKAFRVDLDERENREVLWKFHYDRGGKSKLKYAYYDKQAVYNIHEVADKIKNLIQKSPKNDEHILLKRNEIKDAFFNPLQERLSKTKVFLSHSHIDMKNNDFLGVKNIKSFLEPTDNFKSIFIDSLFWDYKNDVLKEIKKYHVDVSKIEDAFTLILRESLQDMIEKCPYFVFLQSKNSVSNQGISQITYSAWIYEELKIAHSISKGYLMFSFEQEQGLEIKIENDVSPFLESFETITLSELSRQINS
ncbi:TIR domain protein [Helicobacter pylori]|uniref:TIR domain protein n=1 Tax=Helicobacter pylori TaxID=210 RepID=UPI000EAC318B|nr:TIR domain protein [Helicobacter pylori]